MTPTVFGFLIVFAAICLMPASLTVMLGLVLVASLLGGASAVDLPALGGSSIAPASFALVFLVIRILLSPAGRFEVLTKAFARNPFLTCYCVYGAVTAFLLPRLFFHAVSVPQLRNMGVGLYSTTPVEFSSQNITTAVYLLGTLFAFYSAMIAGGLEHRKKLLLKTIAIVSWAHVTFGALDIVLSKIGLRVVLDVFRNAHYQQLVQEVGGVQRVAGIFPEPSAYAGYGFAFLVLNTEMWMRGERPRLTGVTSLALLIILLLTTSTTAYVSIAGYAAVMLLRMAFTPIGLPSSKKLGLLIVASVAGVALLALEVFVPAMNILMLDILQQMTIGKLHSLSGVQRAFWVHKAWEAFWASSWIGIGAGSLRSSGLISAIAGSMGLIGIITFFGAAWMILKPTRALTHRVQVTGEQRLRASFAWAAVLGLIPAFVSQSTVDPGLIFGIFAGLASTDFLGQRAPSSSYFTLQAVPNGSGNLVNGA